MSASRQPLRLQPLKSTDDRAAIPLFTVSDAARFLKLPSETMRNWVRGYDWPGSRGKEHTEPIVTSVPPEKHGYPNIPFVGITEALVLTAFKRQGIRMHKIKQVLLALEREVGVHNALANKSLFTAGADILWDFAKSAQDHDLRDEIKQLVEPSRGQTVFVPAVRQYLQHITYDDDLWALSLRLPAFEPLNVVIDMRRNFGRPILDKSRVRVEDIANRFYAGDTIDSIAADFELDRDEVESIVRVFPVRRAA
ncbi:MAG: DUF433 domain-containing protein [Chloroflexi bacterium]|nr:MAG: DUF433 domain-containing protein [Chloroflexota bacterium]